MKTPSLYPLVFDAVTDPLILVDRSGSVLLANASALVFLDFGELHALSTTTCAEPGCTLDVVELTSQMMRYDSIREYPLHDGDGRDAGVTLDIESVRTPEGQPVYKLLHFRNRSGDRRREFWRDELISMISHEIKNPLSAMKNSVEILLSQLPGELTEGQRRFLRTSERSIDRLTQLLDGFLDVSRISAGAFELNRADTDIRQFLGDVVGSFQTLFNVSRVDLCWSVDREVSKAYLDPSKLEQVIVNLLSNALKFTPERGRISVTARTGGVEQIGDDLRLLPWEMLGEPRLLEISVEDTGLGMSTETLDHLFNRYYASGRGRSGQGSHLGLTISKALVEAQDGWLAVRSQIGIGTTVSVFIPQDRHTACVLSRMRRLNELVTSTLTARRPVALYALGKTDGEGWEDIFGSWPRPPAVNPDRKMNATDNFYAWTIDAALAIAVLLERGDQTPESVFGSRFVQADDASYMFSGYAVGVCHAPAEANSLAQLCHIAMQRMDAARKIQVRSAVERIATGIGSFVTELGE
jgi:signal transduction histidine kinase